MKKIVSWIVIICISGFAYSQTESRLDPEYGGRLELTIDKKLVKGLHLSLSEEVRFADNFGSFNRLHTTAALSYKLTSNIRLGLGYALIAPYSSSSKAFDYSRHRLMLDVAGTLPAGAWRISLKERFQATYRTGDMNEYQNPRTGLALKSRLKISYNGFPRIKPFVYGELRNTLNAPVIKANYNPSTGQYLTDEGSQKGDPGWFIDDFNGCYVNRLRGALGADYRIDKRNYINITLLLDRVSDREVDANASGTKLKSYTYETGFKCWLTCSYKYSF